MGTNIDLLDPDLKQGLRELEAAISQAGLTYTLTSTVRSLREQTFLYNRYISGKSGGLPAAPPGHSAHEYGWAFDLMVTPWRYQAEVGRAWVQTWGGVYGGKRDPVHFELPGAGQLAWQIGEQGAPSPAPSRPQPGGKFYKLADFLSGFVPVLGEVQLVDSLVTLFDGNDDIAGYYLQHPAEAVRDLVGRFL